MSKRTTTAFGLNLVNPDAPDYMGWSGPLKACVNDASAIVALSGQRGHDAATSLVNTYAGQFTAVGNVIPPYRLVMNATAEAWIARHRELAATAQPGDLFVFHYSGHGADRRYALTRTQSLCFGDRMMDEDEFRSLLELWPAGVRAAYILDCCYAGGMYRSNPEYIAMPRTAGVIYSYRDQPESRRRNSIKANVCIMAAAKDNQFALDGEINGAYTGSLLACMNADARLTWLAMHDRVRAFMADTFPAQEPTIEFFNGHEAWREPFMR